MDAAELKRTWALAESLGDEVPLYFYSHLFLSHPDTRDMFPVSMATQRDRLVGALGRIVSHVDRVDEVSEFIAQLGRDHRRFGAVAAHYDAVGASLLATLAHFLGDQWTPQLASDWASAYGLIAKVMVVAADEAEGEPAVWDAEVVDAERLTLDVSKLRLRTDRPYEYRPGQSMAVEIPQRPRLWRYLSPANAPRDDRTIDVHVQYIAGGQVSGALVRRVTAGDKVRLGAPVGTELVLNGGPPRDLLLVAGGTGLAPLRAVLEHLDQEAGSNGAAPDVHLFHGVRLPWGLYDHEYLSSLADARSWFTYTPVVSDDSTYPGRTGLVGQVAAAHPDRSGRLALVCGSPAMVFGARAALARAGTPTEDIRFEQYGNLDEDSHEHSSPSEP
ncbi:MAG TPA: globin domain-containing protein [Lapillicoccus sp.]